jgi:O-antigen/teichoic acid export membrane protein
MLALLKNLGKHSVVYGVGDLLSKSIGFLLIPLYTHYLSPEQYGTLDLLDLTSYIIGLFLAMGLAEAISRFYYDEDSDQVISAALGTILLACFIALLFLIPGANRISVIVFGESSFARLFKIVFLTMSANLLADLPMTVFRIRERSLLVTGVNLVRLSLSLSLNILFLVRFGMGVEGVLYSGLITATLSGIVMNILLLRTIRLRWDRAIWVKMARYGAPLIGSWAGMFVLNFADRFMLQRLSGLEDVGIYALAYKFGMLPNVLLTGPFMMIWGPKRFQLANAGESSRTYGRIFTYYLGLQVLVVVGIAATIAPAIKIVANPRYHEAHLYVLPVLLGYVAYGMYRYTQFGILLKQRTAVLGVFALICGVVNVGLNAWAIPRWGAAGAAWTTLASFLLLLILVTPMAQRLYRIPFELGRVAQLVVAGAVALVVSSLIHLGNPWLEGILRGSVGGLVFVGGLGLSGFLHPEERSALRRIFQRGGAPS